MKKLFWSLLFGIAQTNIAFAQGTPVPEELYDELWKHIDKTPNLTFEIISRGGEFSGCELVFYYPYRDFRALKGEPVIVKGSVSAFYQKGKVFGTLVKVLPQRIQFKDGKAEWVAQSNIFAAVRINGKSMEKYRLAASPCELGGICVAYGDKQGVEYLEETLKTVPYDADIFFRYSKDGIDQRITLSELTTNQDKPQKVRMSFNTCVTQIVNKMVKDLR